MFDLEDLAPWCSYSKLKNVEPLTFYSGSGVVVVVFYRNLRQRITRRALVEPISDYRENYRDSQSSTEASQHDTNSV